MISKQEDSENQPLLDQSNLETDVSLDYSLLSTSREEPRSLAKKQMTKDSLNVSTKKESINLDSHKDQDIGLAYWLVELYASKSQLTLLKMKHAPLIVRIKIRWVFKGIWRDFASTEQISWEKYVEYLVITFGDKNVNSLFAEKDNATNLREAFDLFVKDAYEIYPIIYSQFEANLQGMKELSRQVGVPLTTDGKLNKTYRNSAAKIVEELKKLAKKCICDK